MFSDSVIAYLAAAVIAYLLGSISGAIVSSKVGHKEDIRNYGSGNAGMTNALRTYGIRHAVVVAAMDIFKTIVAILIAKWLVGWHWGFVIGSLFAITGHLFPVYYGFKGGKGVLCGLASLLMVDWRIGLLVVAVFAVVVAICKWVSLGSICACASAHLWCLLLGVSGLHTVYVLLAASWLIWCHRSNIKRLLKGEEPKTVIAKRKPRWKLL
jgi:glycerol-3-phosphate acyltransferase PlsY